VTLDDLRRAAVARSLFTPTTLQRALDELGFVQADPISPDAREAAARACARRWRGLVLGG
jgi:alkylhydroperoxidase family enzyme